MGDATPEDVIAHYLSCLSMDSPRQPDPADRDEADLIVAALAAAGYAVVPAADVDAAARWKAEATAVMDEWDRVWVLLGKPGPFGGSKASNTLAEVQRLVDASARLRAENERLQGDINLVGRIARERDEANDRALKVQVYNIHLRSAVTDYLDPAKSLGPSFLREALSYDPAAAVGSVDPEGERPEGWSTVDGDGQRIWVQATDPARPSACPTCGSDRPELHRLFDTWEDGPEPCTDSWHSPDRGDR